MTSSTSSRAVFDTTDYLMNWLTALDTEGMTGNEVRSAVYSWAIAMRPGKGAK